MADTPGKPEWKVDMTDWIARQTVEKEVFKNYKGETVERTSYGDLAGMMARHIIETKFQDYLYPGPGRTITNKAPGPGAAADYAPFYGKLNPPEASPNWIWENKVTGDSHFGSIGYKGSAKEVFDTTFTMLHELTHARNPLTRDQKTWTLGAPSQEAVTELVKAAVATKSFPSQGESGNLEELMASLSVVRDMNAAGISGMHSTSGHTVQKGYDELNKKFPWMQEYLTVQSQPERKFSVNSPKVTNSPPTLTEAVKAKLKSLFGVK